MRGNVIPAWPIILDIMTDPPPATLIDLNPDWLPDQYRQIAFWQKLRAIPQIIQFKFESWDELVGVLYDHGIIVEGGEGDGQTFFVECTRHYYCRTFAGNLAGYALNSPDFTQAWLDSRLELS